MRLRITSVRVSGGPSHQHVTRLRWMNPIDRSTGETSVAEFVRWLEADAVHTAVAAGARVEVVRPVLGDPWLQSYASGEWASHLLRLPRF